MMWNNMTVAEQLVEVDRRNRNVAGGRSPTDDGDPAHVLTSKTFTPNPPRLPGEPGRSPRPDAVRVRLDWSMLCPDNQRFAPALRRGKPVLVMTQAYRTAKQKAKEALSREHPFTFTGPVRVVAMLFEPDRRTRRDLANYAKLAHDALTAAGILLDDSQIDDVRWIRARVDIDAPRLELVVEALP